MLFRISIALLKFVQSYETHPIQTRDFKRNFGHFFLLLKTLRTPKVKVNPIKVQSLKKKDD